MTDEPTQQNPYEHWLAERRDACPPADLSDRVMNDIRDWERRRAGIWWWVLVERIERQRAARWAVCGAAFAIGSLPYLFLTQVSSF